MEERLEKIENALNNLDRAVRGDGNGEPGLSMKVHLTQHMVQETQSQLKESMDQVLAKIYQSQENIRQNANDTWARIGTVTAIVLAIVLGIYT